MKLPARWREGLLLGALAVLAGWYAAPALPEASTLVRARRDDWQLPALPRRPDLTATAVRVAAAEYWGGPEAGAAAAASVPIEDTRWRIAGLFGSGQGRGVLIRYAAPDKAEQRLRVGDRLPSGHRIVEINATEVCVQVGSRRLRLGIERQHD